MVKCLIQLQSQLFPEKFPPVGNHRLLLLLLQTCCGNSLLIIPHEESRGGGAEREREQQRCSCSQLGSVRIVLKELGLVGATNQTSVDYCSLQKLNFKNQQQQGSCVLDGYARRLRRWSSSSSSSSASCSLPPPPSTWTWRARLCTADLTAATSDMLLTFTALTLPGEVLTLKFKEGVYNCRLQQGYSRCFQLRAHTTVHWTVGGVSKRHNICMSLLKSRSRISCRFQT